MRKLCRVAWMILLMGVKSSRKPSPGSSKSSRWIAQLYQLTFCSVVLMHPFLSPSRYLTWTCVNLSSEWLPAVCGATYRITSVGSPLFLTLSFFNGTFSFPRRRSSFSSLDSDINSSFHQRDAKFECKSWPQIIA